MDAYENIVIGGFIFALGLRLGSLQNSSYDSVAIQLTQQTPLDKTFADLLITNSNFLRIVEFKRKSNRGNQKERTKHASLKMSLNDMKEDLDCFLNLHWYAESEFSKHNSQLSLVPYLEYPSLATRKIKPLTMHEFIEDIVSPTSFVPEELISRYVAILRGLSVNGDGGSDATGYLIVTRDAEGKIGLATVTKFEDLYVSREMLLQNEIKMEPRYNGPSLGR